MPDNRIKEARDVVNRLEGEEGLGRRKQNKLDEARGVLEDRRKLTRNLIFVTLFVASGGGFLLKSAMEGSTETQHGAKLQPVPETKSQPVPEPVPQIDEEKATDLLIQRAEEGFERFRATMMPKIETVSEPRLREELNGPFDVIKLNQEFPGRNAPRLDREKLAKGITQTGLSNPYFFTYLAKDLPPGAAATFSPSIRRMQLVPNFDANNILDMLILYHELRHVIMDTNIRMGFTPAMVDEYMANFHRTKQPGDKMHMNVLEEVFAFGLELEMLNLYLNGELKKAFIEGRPITSGYVLQKLKGRTDQLGTVTMLLELASAYYPLGIRINPQGRMIIEKSFMNVIAREIKKLGFLPFTFDPVGGTKEYKW